MIKNVPILKRTVFKEKKKCGTSPQAFTLAHSHTQPCFSVQQTPALTTISVSPQQQHTIVHCPHDAKSRSPYFIKRFPPCEHLPQNDSPAEHITLLTVVRTCGMQTQQRSFNNDVKGHLERLTFTGPKNSQILSTHMTTKILCTHTHTHLSLIHI